MKLCPIHKTKLTKRENKRENLQTYARALNKFYGCKECDGIKWHVYCYLCDKIISMTSAIYYPDVTKHNSEHHSQSLRLFAYSSDKLITVDAAGVNDPLLEIVINNPQFALIFPDNTDITPHAEDFYENELDYNTSRRIYPLPESDDVRMILFESWLKSPFRTYRCRFCEENYECLPSLKIARRHVRECEAHRILDRERVLW